MFDKFRDNWRKKREIKARKKSVMNAVVSGTPGTLKAALEAARPDGLLTADEKSRFMKAAIDRQDLKVFRELLSFIDDPNAEISYEVSTGRYSTTYRYSPLTYALSVARTHDIALALANNPRTSFSADNLEGARQGGMQDVAGILAKRMAELRRLEAEQLDREAAQKSHAAAQAVEPAAPPPETAPQPEPALAAGESWALMTKTSIAHVSCAEAIGRRLTEIFNFESRERVLITENIKTGVEAVGAAEPFDKLSPDSVRRAEKMLQDLTGEPGAKNSLSL